MIKPIAVLISDIHYSLNTYEIADQALRTAIDKASELNIPLIDCGDLTNDKAVLRGEVMNALLETMEYASSKRVPVILLVGNHSLVNEKGAEHVLNFLRPWTFVVDHVTHCPVSMTKQFTNVMLMPYFHDLNALTDELKKIPKNSLLIMHQGFKGAWMGDYVQDKTSVDPELVKDYKVYSGHYHRHQTLGTITYVGNPYTLSFGEAYDDPKGFLIVNEDGTFTREILNLRKHVILDLTTDMIMNRSHSITPQDLVWIKVEGTETELSKINKQELGERLLGHSNYRLELIPNDSKTLDTKMNNMTGEQILDALIDNKGENVEELKRLWRTLV